MASVTVELPEEVLALILESYVGTPGIGRVCDNEQPRMALLGSHLLARSLRDRRIGYKREDPLDRLGPEDRALVESATKWSGPALADLIERGIACRP